MGAKTEISWTDATWNPIRGCSMAKGSETGGCLNCYAARLNARNLPELKSPTTGKPFARILQSGPRWTGEVELIESQLTLPLKWRKPKRIFVNSLSDLFHESLPNEAIDPMFAVMALCRWHTFQALTKRPERMFSYVSGVKALSPKQRSLRFVRSMYKGHPAERVVLGGLAESSCGDMQWPLPNVWLGVSVEDQKTADARIPLLLQTPAAKRFVSYEPALGPITFRPEWMRGLSWIIVGGESGPGARPFNIQWARNTVEQCKAAGVACFVKQLGAKPQEIAYPRDVTDREAANWMRDGWTRITDDNGQHWRKYLRLKDRKGGDWAEWPEDLRVRQFPTEGL